MSELFMWHTLPGCGLWDTTNTLHGRCYHCGATEPEPTNYHRLADCPTPKWGVCYCLRPAEDFLNGYCNELTAESPRAWSERANGAWGWGSINRWLNRFYFGNNSVAIASTRETPIMKALKKI